MVVTCVKLPDIPVTSTVAFPVVAVLLAMSVSVLVPVAGFELNEAVTPPGSPEAARFTLLLKPFCGVTVIVLIPLDPCTRVRLLGDAERVKFGVWAFVLIVTLSNVALARLAVLPLLTPRPIYTLCPMGIVRLVPSCTQFTPSNEL